MIDQLGLRVVIDKSYRRGPVGFDARSVRLLWREADESAEGTDAA